jgi:hypothetical protein
VDETSAPRADWAVDRALPARLREAPPVARECQPGACARVREGVRGAHGRSASECVKERGLAGVVRCGEDRVCQSLITPKRHGEFTGASHATHGNRHAPREANLVEPQEPMAGDFSIVDERGDRMRKAPKKRGCFMRPPEHPDPDPLRRRCSDVRS